MDLFDDLPEPEKGKASDSPQSKTQSWDDAKLDFFSDLPLPSTTADNRGIKRKLDENDIDSSQNEIQESLYHIQGYYAEKKGEREEMQDFHVLIDDFHKHIPHLHPSISRLSYYAVFDGHGGVRASRFASSQLHLTLAEKFPKGPLSQIEKDIKRTMAEVFKKTDEEFLKQATKTKPSWKDGTTAIVVIVLQNILYISNLGDSKAILCRYNKDSKKYVSVPLSTDHSPTDYKERMRIQKAGGCVRMRPKTWKPWETHHSAPEFPDSSKKRSNVTCESGPMDNYAPPFIAVEIDGRVMGIIEVSRSIGDGQYKGLGITSIPDIKRCQLTDDDMFILLACDGLWKVFTSEEVLQIIFDSKKEPVDKQNSEICYETACNRLVNEAIRKHSGDNVTVVIVSIKKHK